jgi:cholesterol 7-dehydrogenase
MISALVFMGAVGVAYVSSGKWRDHFQFVETALEEAWRDLQKCDPSDLLFWGSVFIAFSVLMYWVLDFFFAYLIRERHLEEIGYLNHDGKNPLAHSNDMKKRRDRGNLPPPFPNGWYCLAWSREIEEKGVKNVEALGNHFAIFRGENGEAYVLDAYCPHLGANIACGGSVKGNALQCPFHGWEFRGEDGKCINIPYANGPIPSNAKTKSWPTMEMNGQILVWFDAEGREPMWAPPAIPGIEEGSWSRRGHTRHTINAHIQEVPENGADVPHLNFLHGPIVLAGNDLRTTHKPSKLNPISWLQHTWDAGWKPGKGDLGHIAFLTLRHGISLFGHDIPLLALELEAQQVGPGIVYLVFKCPFGQGAFVQSLLPVGPLEQIVTHEVWGEWRLPTVVAKFMLHGEAMQVERDVMVWNNKRFNNKPVLTKDEGLILQFRRWFSQFYSENSRAVAEKSVNVLDW